MITALRTVHLLAAAVWFGGTVALVFIGVPAIRTLEGEPRALALRKLGRRWRPIGWSAMGIAILSGLWLSDRHGAFHSESLGSHFDRVLIAKSVLVVALCAGAVLHDYVLGPRLQRQTRENDERAPATRRRLVVLGWFNFALTVAVPILGVVLLSDLT